MDPHTPPNKHDVDNQQSLLLEIHTNKHRIREEPHVTPLRQKDETIPPMEIRSTKVPQKEFRTEVKSTQKHDSEKDDVNELIFQNSALFHPNYEDIQSLKCQTRMSRQNIHENDDEMSHCLKKYDELCEVIQHLKKLTEKQVVNRCENIMGGKKSINAKCGTIYDIQSKRDYLQDNIMKRHYELKEIEEEKEGIDKEV